MTTVYSKLSRLPDPMATPKLDNLDGDLIDKIKIVISKLKTTNQRQRKRPQKLRTAKDLCSVCDKTYDDNQDAISCVHSVISGYTKNVMQCL